MSTAALLLEQIKAQIGGRWQVLRETLGDWYYNLDENKGSIIFVPKSDLAANGDFFMERLRQEIFFVANSFEATLLEGFLSEFVFVTPNLRSPRHQVEPSLKSLTSSDGNPALGSFLKAKLMHAFVPSLVRYTEENLKSMQLIAPELFGPGATLHSDPIPNPSQKAFGNLAQSLRALPAQVLSYLQSLNPKQQSIKLKDLQAFLNRSLAEIERNFEKDLRDAHLKNDSRNAAETKVQIVLSKLKTAYESQLLQAFHMPVLNIGLGFRKGGPIPEFTEGIDLFQHDEASALAQKILALPLAEIQKQRRTRRPE